MSWTNLDIKLQPRVSHCNITVSRTPVSSLHVPNLPATRGAVDFAQVNTGGVLEPNRNFTPWGTWTQGGLNTCKVTGDTLLKLSGYGWQSADGGLEVESGMRRFRFTLSRLTGAVQIGVSAARGRSDEIPDTWNDPAMVDRAWFMTGSGNLHNGSIRVFQTGKKLREGDVVGVEVRLDEAEVTFRKLHSSKCGDHVFGTHCQACVDGFKTRGEEPPAGFMPRRACLLWNADGPKDDDGFVGTLSGVMSFKDRVTLGHLPRGTVDNHGVWRHPGGRRMEKVVKEFLHDNFGQVVRMKLDFEKRLAVVQMTEALALLSDGTFVSSPYHSILQKLPGLHMIDMKESEAPKTFLIPYLNEHSDPDHTHEDHHGSWFNGIAETRPGNWDKFLAQGGLFWPEDDDPKPVVATFTTLARVASSPAAWGWASSPGSRSSSPWGNRASSPWGKLRSGVAVASTARPRSPENEPLASPPATPEAKATRNRLSTMSMRAKLSLLNASIGARPLSASDSGGLVSLSSLSSSKASSRRRRRLPPPHAVGPFIVKSSGRGGLFAGTCLCSVNTAIRMEIVDDELAKHNVVMGRYDQLKHFGTAPSPWGHTDQMLAEPSLLVDKHCVTKISRPGVGGKGPYFASAIGMAHLSRDYPPPFHDPAATSQGWGPHYEGQWVVHETKTVDSDPDEAVASEEGSPAKEKGAKGDKGGGQPKFSWQLIMDKKINMRRFNVRIKQMGPHSDVHSGGIRIGVVAAKPTVPTFASPALDRCWRSALFDNRIWYVDGSIGEDHNKSPMGGGLYNGSTLCFPRKYTRLSGGFVQNDLIGIEVDMGRLVKGADGVFHSDPSRMPAVRFSRNGKVIPGVLTHPFCSVGLEKYSGPDGEPLERWLQVHPAVCLQTEGDEVELEELGWTVWPCPHDSIHECPRCVHARGDTRVHDADFETCKATDCLVARGEK